MSCVISTCMACIGADLASLDAMSLSGAPIRAMPPGGSSAVAMLNSKSDFLQERRIRGVKLAPSYCQG